MKITVLDRESLGSDTPFEILHSLGEVVFYDSTPPNLLSARISDSDVIIINKIKITEDVIKSSQNLKLICVFATGFDNIDINAAKKKGIAVCNVPGYSTQSVALYTVATVTALYSKIIQYRNYVISGEYTKSGVPNKLTPVFHEIAGKKWGIVGYGNIGKAVAKVAAALGAEVLVNKKTPVSDVSCVDIDTLCRESDIITIHCPLNDETRGLISKEKISLMKKDVIIVNEARGAVVVEEDIRDAVLSGNIAGFGCDVYSTEPFSEFHPYNDIMKLGNVILTPHAAWGSYEARKRCIGIIAENIKSFENGISLNRVDK